MGLQVNSYEIANTGIILENIYAKITDINLSLPSKNCFIKLSYYINKTIADNGKMFIDNYVNSFIIPDANGDLRAQAYTYLKTLPEFLNTTDL